MTGTRFLADIISVNSKQTVFFTIYPANQSGCPNHIIYPYAETIERNERLWLFNGLDAPSCFGAFANIRTRQRLGSRFFRTHWRLHFPLDYKFHALFSAFTLQLPVIKVRRTGEEAWADNIRNGVSALDDCIVIPTWHRRSDGCP